MITPGGDDLTLALYTVFIFDSIKKPIIIINHEHLVLFRFLTKVDLHSHFAILQHAQFSFGTVRNKRINDIYAKCIV